MVQSTTLTLGMDIGDRFTQFCLLPVMGEDPVEEGRVATTPAGISEFLGGRPRCRVVFEVGCHSPWINDLAEEAGHEDCAYCLMLTHFHLLVRSPAGQLSGAMRLIQNPYVRWFSLSRRRDCSLFRNSCPPARTSLR